jgi:hypothetical protein
LADEYCCDGGYFETETRPNVYDELSTCQSDAPNLGRTVGDCRQFTETESRGGDTFAISEPDSSDDLMTFNGTPQAADIRRIQWIYDACSDSDCGGGPRCEISNIMRGCTPEAALRARADRATVGVVIPPIDPRIESIPEFVAPVLERGLALTVQFNNATDVEVVEAIVTDTDSPMHLGNPPLILVESLDGSRATLNQFNAWHPLWLHEQTEDGEENLTILTAGVGTFIAPFHPRTRSIRVSDVELGLELVTADVADVVIDFCAANPTEPTYVTSAVTTTTTLPSGGACGDPIDHGAQLIGPGVPLVTASDALFALQAAVGLITCELCVCDVNASGAVTAADALRILASAVGQDVTLDCLPCS